MSRKRERMIDRMRAENEATYARLREGSKAWADKTADEIVDDMVKIVSHFPQGNPDPCPECGGTMGLHPQKLSHWEGDCPVFKPCSRSGL